MPGEEGSSSLDLVMAVKGITGRCAVIGLHRSRGVALARILVTVAIIAIVGTVAVPISRDYLDSTYSAQAVSDLGSIEIAIARYKAQNRGELPASLEQLQVGGWKDPWGHPYRYKNLEVAEAMSLARRDSGSNPLNRDYDLYSVGKDGRTAESLSSSFSGDDVIRALGGNFFGIAGEYPGQ